MDNESRLKIYFGPNERLEVNDSSPEAKQKEADYGQKVVVKLAEILDPLTDAIDTNRAWLNDFREDEVTISKDLHDVLTVYRNMRRSA